MVFKRCQRDFQKQNMENVFKLTKFISGHCRVHSNYWAYKQKMKHNELKLIYWSCHAEFSSAISYGHGSAKMITL